MPDWACRIVVSFENRMSTLERLFELKGSPQHVCFSQRCILFASVAVMLLVVRAFYGRQKSWVCLQVVSNHILKHRNS